MEVRDKHKHSVDNVSSSPKKGGAGGKGTWGSYKDDAKYIDVDEHALNKDDPNFDPADVAEGGYDLDELRFVPALDMSSKFSKTLKDLANFKNKVKSAVAEHLIQDDVAEFCSCLKEIDFPLFHQELPAILIKSVLDKKDEDRMKVSHLLAGLHKNNMLTPNQVAQSFKKLFNNLDELLIDFPDAKKHLSDFLGHATAGGYLDGKEAAAIEKAVLYLENQDSFAKTKRQIKEMVTEYFTSEELEELATASKNVHHATHFELVKQLVMTSLDRSNRERELASKALASLSSSVIDHDSVNKAFLIMVSRVEDTFLDVPDILHLMSCFLARSVVDEVLPPSFLVRLDLSEMDMGYQVITQAQVLLSAAGSAVKLQSVWGARPDDD
eukprot:CAMPEP_0175101008 /NCGR_PEP_ID=MMETSP0086_2-20121207/7504_1 /TAXON_ID=136419 /ORGANISM="Unknown Unknown, Strain D1" /LENGTH=381 /DNA_ID=CAMNT_0016375383 /DNA_START=119 /DNA_END=1264 /DNA_ORIENTATION=-